MSSYGGQKFLAGALILSAVAHLGIMYAMRPQVMTNYFQPSRHVTPRRPMEMREPKPPPPGTVRFEDLTDVEAKFDSPEAVSKALLPMQSSDVDATLDGTTPPLPPDQEAVLPPQPKREVAPRLFEKVHVEDMPSYVAPVVMDSGIGLTPPVTKPLEAPKVDVVPPAPDPVLVPVIEPPALEAMPKAEDKVSLVEATAREEVKEDFTPPKQVMDEIDESIVSAEKAAVRNLLDVSRPRPLTKFVNASLTSAEAGEWNYFRVRITPQQSLEIVPKDVVILIDASGSIADDRLGSCRKAAQEFLRSCMNTGDRFNLVAFRNDFDYAFREWQNCDQPSFDAADRWMRRLTAHGRTDVFSTIASVLKLPRNPRRPMIALVVTDGDANTGVSKTADILSKFTALNDGLVSVYMYGVKQGANRELIDVLTRGNRGDSLVYEGNRKFAGRKIGELSERFRDPVLSDLRIVFTTASNADVYPRRLKNLYRGECVDIIGRVPTGTPQVAFSLKGLNGSRAYEAMFRLTLGQGGMKEFDPQLPELWRQEKVIDAKLH
ncbi:MAG: VWA domain-containing protein [Kiritimatiellia bacterium]